jgi:hypothetical protein
MKEKEKRKDRFWMWLLGSWIVILGVWWITPDFVAWRIPWGENGVRQR